MRFSLLRYTLLTVLLSFVAIAANAQDKLYLDDGTVIEAKVREINSKSIVYRRWDNQEGADYVISRRDVNRIVYQNGAVETDINRSSGRPRRPFERSMPRRDEESTDARRNTTGRTPAMDPGYGRNIIAFAPVQMTEESVSGLGLHYERIIGKSGSFAFDLPVVISFYGENNGSNPAKRDQRIFTFLYPGAKFYPGGSGRRASYSVGPSLGFGFGSKYKVTRTYDPVTGSLLYRYDDASVFKAGLMINNGVNIQPTKALYVGAEFGIGILYYDNEDTDFVVGDKAMIQFNLKIGYRF